MGKSLPTKPLEFNDFSGGITENILQGDPRRYERADNFFITVDHKLEERPGFLPDGETSYQIPGFLGQRINGYHAVHQENELIPQVSRSLFFKNDDGDWAQIFGIGGRQALSGGDQFSQTTLAEFQKVVYLATDGDDENQGVLPSKIYKDDTDSWVARTAGLPRSWVDGNYSDSSLLAKCITNANALRASMVLHFQDATNPTYVNPTTNQVAPPGILHVNIDRYALSYFQSVVFGADTNRPSPIPTPLGPCTNQATLFALITALNLAYSEHVPGDAMANSWGTQIGSTFTNPVVRPRYHSDMPSYLWAFSAIDFPLQKTKGPGAKLNANGTPDTIAEAAAMLDDLWQKWNWHRLAVNTHDGQNNPSNFDKYAPAGTKIGDIFLGDQNFPRIIPDFSDIAGFANNLKYFFNGHVTNNPTGFGLSGHKMRDNPYYNMMNECRIYDANDLDSTYLLIYWLRSCYQMHFADAGFINPTFTNITFTGTAGSPNLTACVVQATGAALGAGFVAYFAELGATQLQSTVNKYAGTGNYTTARIIASGAGTLTLDSNCAATGAGQTAQLTNLIYHRNINNFGALADRGFIGTNEQAADQLSNDAASLGTDTKSWLALGQDLFFAMASHIQYQTNHLTSAAGTFQNRVLTVPAPPFYVPAVAEYAYAMFFQDKYTVGKNGVEYEVNGNPIFSLSTDCAVSYPVGAIPVNLYPSFYQARPILGSHQNLLYNLPVLVNDATTNYNVDDITLEIYRTTDGGQTFYKLASVPNGTTFYSDFVNDTLSDPNGNPSLTAGQTIYTSGGVVGDDQPPISKYTHILGNTAYYGAVTDGDQYFANRIRQSKENQPDSAPATFFDDLDSPLVGISSARNNLITFCETSIYRMAGQFNSQGQGAITHENISDTLGCLNAKSIIRTEIGVFFAGTDGFYYTDGYQIINITLELKDTYANLTATAEQKRSIYGGYDKITRRIWWAMKTAQYDSDNSIVYVYYLNFGVKPSGVFTTISNGLNFRPSSLVFQNGVAHVAHEKGYLFKLDKWNKWDALIDDLETADNWVHELIPYDYRSVAIDLGTTFQRKWLTKVHLVGNNKGNAAIQPYALRDLNEYGQGAVPMAPINYTQNFTWGDPTFIWGNDECVWKTDGKMDLWRRFPAGQLRSDFMQIQFKPAYIAVYASSVGFPYGSFSSINSIAKTMRISTPPGFTHISWPLDVVGYEIAFSFDEYTQKWPIISVNDQTIEVDDPDNLLPDTGLKFEWEIWGFKKEQRVHISSYVLHFAYLGDENQHYPGAASTDGPGNAGGNPIG